MRVNPALPAVTGPVLRLTVTITNEAQLYENILDYMAAAPIGVTLAVQTTFLTNWIAANQASYAGTLGVDSSITRYTVAEVKDGVAPTLVSNTGGVIGTVAGDSYPGTVAAVITKYSAFKGQHGRGRIYRGPVPLSFLTPGTDSNHLNAAAIAAYLTSNNALLGVIVSAGVNWNLSITTRPLPPMVLVSKGTMVTGLTTTTNTGTVRRRRYGRGQ